MATRSFCTIIVVGRTCRKETEILKYSDINVRNLNDFSNARERLNLYCATDMDLANDRFLITFKWCLDTVLLYLEIEFFL